MSLITSVKALFKPKSAPCENTSERLEGAAAVAAPERCVFSAFDISVSVPGDWIVRPDHRGRDFCFENGFYRFEKTFGKSNQGTGDSVSFGLRWEGTGKERDNEAFIEDFIKVMEAQYNKSMKKSSDFKYQGCELAELSGGIKACLMRISYSANNKLFGKGGQRISVTTAAFLHEPTARRVISSVIALEKRMERDREELESLLYTIEMA